MTKEDLVEKVTGAGDLTRRDGEVIVETIFDAVIGALKSGDKIEIRGFGSFRRARRGSGKESTLFQAFQGAARPGEPQGSQERSLKDEAD